MPHYFLFPNILQYRQNQYAFDPEVTCLSKIGNRLLEDELGQAVTEYGIILGIMAIGVVGALYAVREPLMAFYQSLSQKLSDIVGI